MSSRSPGPSSIAVIAILTDGDTPLEHTLEAAAAQTYEPAGLYVVGAAAAAAAATHGVPWAESVADLLSQLDSSVSHVWLLAGGAVPRPDALYALVFESSRLGAGMAGSKLLDLEHAERLVSVGIATDVFGVPSVGLDEEEVDAGQYDVVRDVAAVAGASILARRDLLKGIGGPDHAMPAEAAALDLSQRARMLGARVVVVPSSEVAVPPQAAAPRWRDEAGRIRSMIKTYSLVTLLWALPLRFLVGFVEGLLVPFLGRWTLFAWLRAWAWNLGRLPATFRERRALHAAAVAGDAELFRYQIRGSVSLKSLWADLVDAARARFPSAERAGLGSLMREMRRPAFGVGLVAVMFSLVATRDVWSGFPASGLSLPLPESGADAVTGYGGGWNPAGFGSTEQLPPFLGIAGLWQQLVFDDPRRAAGALTLVAFIAGIWGTARLLRTWSVESVPGILAGITLMAGPAARTIAGSGDVPNLIGLALVPWTMRLAVAPWPATWLRRIARVLGAGWMSGLLANTSPELLALPVAALLIWAPMAGERTAWLQALVAGLGAAIALPLLRPWIGRVDLAGYLRSGDAFWEPGLLLLAAAVTAAIVVIAAATGLRWRLGLWGSLVAAAGGIVARSADVGGGRHLEALGLAAVALGTALVAGIVFESVRRFDEVAGVRRALLGLGAVAAAVVVVSSALVLAPGRGGLPADDFTAALRFTGAATDDESASRVLMIGSPEALPGTVRRVRGAAYRVISAPVPELWEVELPAPGPADAALEAVLERVVDGETFRAGQQLAEFGIRWIVAMDETPLTGRFAGKLDLIPLDGLPQDAFLVDVEQAVRAVTDDGVPWVRRGTGYAGDPAPAVLVREHAHPGWGDDADPDDWAMTLDGAAGSVEFAAGSAGDEARVSLWAGVGLAVLSAVLRRRR